MKKVLISVGTRPNIIKITQFKKRAPAFNIEVKIVHTGQHYDHKMAQVFYDQFGLQPDFRQELKPGNVLTQITQIMHNVTEVIDDYRPEILLTPGDVNSTFAAAYAAYQSKLPIGHIESGLRSNDREMPEEINRILTDELTDHFFVTEPSGMKNLKRLGKTDQQVHFVGNTMIDTLVAFEPQIDQSRIRSSRQIPEQYSLFTFHRPGNVDNDHQLNKLVNLIEKTAEEISVVFPVHPRTLNRLQSKGVWKKLRENINVHLLEPLNYFDFQHLVKHSELVITDSGGIQEETTFRRVPCITVRPNTERPITIDEGTNELSDFDVELILNRLKEVLSGKAKQGRIPDMWDGEATTRILEIIRRL